MDGLDAAGSDEHGLDNRNNKLSSGYRSIHIESDTGLLVGGWTEEQEVEEEYDNTVTAARWMLNMITGKTLKITLNKTSIILNEHN